MSSITASAISEGISGLIEGGKSLLENPLVSITTGAVLGSATTAGVILASQKLSSSSKTTSRKRTGRRIQHTSRGWKQDRARFNKRQKWEVAYRRKKAKKRHGRRVKYTKNGQPYILLSSGKAKFIKK